MRAVARRVQPGPPVSRVVVAATTVPASIRGMLHEVCPEGSPAILDGFANSMQECVNTAGLTTTARLAAFIGQCAEESDGFRTTVEYASGNAYNGRRDLGNNYPADGPRFKGRGLIQLTGRANYREAGRALSLPLETDPEGAAKFPGAALVAAWYWETRRINAWADRWDLLQVTRLVNGGEDGFATRKLYSNRALAALHKGA